MNEQTVEPASAIRWCGLAALVGGALVALFYAFLVGRQALDWQAGPTLGTPAHRPLMATVTAAMPLLMGGVTGLLAWKWTRLGWMGSVGGVVTLAGFALWAYAAAANFTWLPAPPWLPVASFPALVAVGSLALGLSVARVAVARGAGLLVGIGGVVGIGLLTVADVAAWLPHLNLSVETGPLARMGGYLAMLHYGSGWAWLGFDLWRRRSNGCAA
jgi:hypothetical protein